MHLCYIQIVNVCKVVTDNSYLSPYGNEISENNGRRTEKNPIVDSDNGVHNQNGIMSGISCRVCVTHISYV